MTKHNQDPRVARLIAQWRQDGIPGHARVSVWNHNINTGESVPEDDPEAVWKVIQEDTPNIAQMILEGRY